MSYSLPQCRNRHCGNVNMDDKPGVCRPKMAENKINLYVVNIYKYCISFITARHFFLDWKQQHAEPVRTIWRRKKKNLSLKNPVLTVVVRP